MFFEASMLIVLESIQIVPGFTVLSKKDGGYVLVRSGVRTNGLTLEYHLCL